MKELERKKEGRMTYEFSRTTSSNEFIDVLDGVSDNENNGYPATSFDDADNMIETYVPADKQDNVTFAESFILDLIADGVASVAVVHSDASTGRALVCQVEYKHKA